MSGAYHHRTVRYDITREDIMSGAESREWVHQNSTNQPTNQVQKSVDRSSNVLTMAQHWTLHFLVVICCLFSQSKSVRYGHRASTLHFPPLTEEERWGFGSRLVKREEWSDSNRRQKRDTGHVKINLNGNITSEVSHLVKLFKN